MNDLKDKIDLDIDPTAKFEMEEMAIRGGQAERWEPGMFKEVRETVEQQEPMTDARLQALVDEFKQRQQIDVHGMVKRYFQTISLPALWAVATDNYIKKSTERLARKRIGRQYKRKAHV